MNEIRRKFSTETNKFCTVYKEMDHTYKKYMILTVNNDDEYDEIINTIKSINKLKIDNRLYDLKNAKIARLDKSDLDDLDDLDYSDYSDDLNNTNTSIKVGLVNMFDSDNKAFYIPYKYDSKDNTCIYVKNRIAWTITYNYKDIINFYIGKLGNPNNIAIVDTGIVTASKIIKPIDYETI